jgi:hypothetical protein
MNSPWFDPTLSILFAVGVGGSVLGLLGVLRRSAERWLSWPVLLAVVLPAGGFCAAAVACRQPIGVWLPPALLLAVVVTFRMVQSPSCGRFAAALARVTCPPRRQACALLVLSPLLALAWIHYLTLPDGLPTEWSDLPQLKTPDRLLEDISPTPARTDGGTPVKLQRRTGIIRSTKEMAARQAELLRRWGMEQSVIALPESPEDCNCHGWTFTAGTCWVPATEIDLILKENGYKEVSTPQPGDLVVYRSTSQEAIHTGVVRMLGDGGLILVESKWGELGRFLHPVDTQPYGEANFLYYRSPRAGHLLRGLSAPSHPEPSTLRTGAREATPGPADAEATATLVGAVRTGE